MKEGDKQLIAKKWKVAYKRSLARFLLDAKKRGRWAIDGDGIADNWQIGSNVSHCQWGADIIL
jgi:hypothetical protein